SLPPTANNEPADTSIARGPILGLEDTAATSPPQLERLHIAEPSDSTRAQETPAPKSPALTEPSTPRADTQSSEPQPSTSKSSTLPSTSRNPTSLSAPRRLHTPASSTSSASAVPPKRERLSQPEAMPNLDGAKPHMAGPPLPPTTPDNYTNAWVPYHPWAQYLARRPIYSNLSEASVTSHLPSFVYRHLGPAGYFSGKFARSLFPRHFVGTLSQSTTTDSGADDASAAPTPNFRSRQKDALLPCVALPCGTVHYRPYIRSDNIIVSLRAGRFRSTDPKFPQSPEGRPPTLRCPPMRNGALPALYQVVSKNHGQGVVLEAKDFLIPGPDHLELHCIVLDQYAVNSLSQTRGFDRSQMSVKDFVWVQSIKPTRAALENPEATLAGARLPRVTAMDTRHPYFFRVHEFILVTLPSTNEIVLGLVLEVPRRGARNDRVNNFRIALEGCPEAISIAPKICEFDITETRENQLLLAETRVNVSTAMRFSQLPASEAAQYFLTNAIRVFLPACPDAAILPLRVFRPTPADEKWVRDREARFSNYPRNKKVARKRMGKIFSVACAALAATSHAADDKSTHRVMATVPSPHAHPIRLRFELEGITSETGWNLQRPTDVWIVDSEVVGRLTISRTSFDFARRITDVELHSTINCHRPLRRAIQEFGQTGPDDRTQVG
ncbi:unnamed protein product, partial [Heligmosomoides polygyrus]|uniref:RHD domain-containing protein n=1 Tax=Heligmosomoides polygyrus TaxID=6339 RepID=A0A183GVE3_HELPZ